MWSIIATNNNRNKEEVDLDNAILPIPVNEYYSSIIATNNNNNNLMSTADEEESSLKQRHQNDHVSEYLSEHVALLAVKAAHRLEVLLHELELMLTEVSSLLDLHFSRIYFYFFLTFFTFCILLLFR